MPEISIIIPMYNTENYIKECIESVKNQLFSDYECIIVDDGSTDESVQLAYEAIGGDRRFRIYEEVHKGVSYAVKKGVEEATGNWLYFVDSDDWIENFEISSLYEELQKHPCDLIASNYMIDEDGWSHKEFFLRVDGYVARNEYEKKLYPQLLSSKKRNGIIIGNSRSAKLIRRELVLANIDYQLGMIYGEDEALMLAVLLDSKNIYTMPGKKCGYHYRYHSGQTVKRKDLQMMISILEGNTYINDILRKKNLPYNKKIKKNARTTELVFYRSFLRIFADDLRSAKYKNKELELEVKKIRKNYKITDLFNCDMTTAVALLLLKLHMYSAIKYSCDIYVRMKKNNYGTN